jgi:hypothetical protein
VNPHYPAVAERAGHRCEYCRAPEAVFNFPFEVEHIIPPGAGGADADWNLALACRACNVCKSNHTQGADPDSLLLVDLFHPRRQHWPDHFHADEHGMIIGKTSSGRATVARLQMNSANQWSARLHWIRLEIYP